MALTFQQAWDQALAWQQDGTIISPNYYKALMIGNHAGDGWGYVEQGVMDNGVYKTYAGRLDFYDETFPSAYPERPYGVYEPVDDGAGGLKIIDPNGNELDMNYDPLDPRTEGQKEFDLLKDQYSMTDEELYFWLSTAAALILAGTVTTAPILGPALMSVGFNLGALALIPGIDMPVLHDKTSTELNSSDKVKDTVTVNLVDRSGDLEKVRDELKGKDLDYPVSDIFLGDTSLSYGVELAEAFNVGVFERNQVSSELSTFISGVFDKSTKMKDDITNNIQQKVLSAQDFYNNFKSDLENYTPTNQTTKDILTSEFNKMKNPIETFDKIFNDSEGNISSGSTGDYLNPSLGEIKDQISQGGSNGGSATVVINQGGDSVDLSGVVASLDAINETILNKPVASSTYQELTAKLKASEEHGYRPDGYGGYEKYKDGIRDKEGQVADYRKDVEFDETVVRTHTLSDGTTIEIKKGYKQNIVASKVAEKNLEQHYREEGKNEADIIASGDNSGFNDTSELSDQLPKLSLVDPSVDPRYRYYLEHLNALLVAQGKEPISFDSSLEDSANNSVLIPQGVPGISD